MSPALHARLGLSPEVTQPAFESLEACYRQKDQDQVVLGTCGEEEAPVLVAVSRQGGDQFRMLMTDGQISINWIFEAVHDCYSRGRYGPDRVARFYLPPQPEFGEEAGEFAYLRFCANGLITLRSNYAAGTIVSLPNSE